AATSPHPAAPPPSQGLVAPPQTPAGQPLGSGTPLGSPTPAQHYQGAPTRVQPPPGPGSAYARYQQVQKRRSPVGWWLAGAAVLVAIVVVAVIAVRGTTSGGGFAGVPGRQGTQSACPPEQEATAEPTPDPNDGRVHGGPVSYPELGAPWGPPNPDTRVPFGSDALTQTVTDQLNYDGRGHSWVASILVAELQAGDGFFSPKQGSEVVVKCILGAFYGDAPVTSDVQVNKQATIDGHDAWIVESQLHFDIPHLRAKGERLIVAIVSAGSTSGLYYASIPDTMPELVRPAREALAELQVDG
ncbi:MAG: hypothetical protein ACJ72K_02670, partial [Friedmanniella sp.]